MSKPYNGNAAVPVGCNNRCDAARNQGHECVMLLRASCFSESLPDTPSNLGVRQTRNENAMVPGSTRH